MRHPPDTGQLFGWIRAKVSCVSSSFSGVPCPNPECGKVLPSASPQDFVDYFEGRLWRCESCGRNEGLWRLLFDRLRDDNPLIPGVLSLGLAVMTVFQCPIEDYVALTMDLSRHGVPADATIIDIVITPYADSEPGPLPAVQLQHLQVRELPHCLTVHPVPWFGEGKDSPPEGAGFTVLAIWMPAALEPEQQPLLSAAKAFVTGDYRGSIIPAQVAVELKLSKVLTDHFRQFAGKETVKNFLNDGASYGHQLRMLVPSLFQFIGAPSMPNEVAAGLQALRKKRNQVGHEHLATDRSEAAQMLLASLFGYWYVAIYGPGLVQSSDSSTEAFRA